MKGMSLVLMETAPDAQHVRRGTVRRETTSIRHHQRVYDTYERILSGSMCGMASHIRQK
jgi:hypothetical protein